MAEEIRISRAVLRVEADERGVLMEKPGAWRQRLTRRQALELGEALERAGSAALPPGDDE